MARHSLTRFTPGAGVLLASSVFALFGFTAALPLSAAADSTGDATVTVFKTLVNNNGGKTELGDFGFTLERLVPESVDAWEYVEDAAFEEDGVSFVVSPGTYRVTETDHDGYAVSYENCGEEGSPLVLSEYAHEECTITNDDLPPILTLITNVVGGSATASDWTLTATRSLPTPVVLSGQSGVTSGSDFQAGVYSFSLSGPEGYTAGDWSCELHDVNGLTDFDSQQLTLEAGDESTCTVTNTAVQGPPVDVCPNDEGVQTSTEECSVPPVDVCPDDEGVQTSTEECSVPPVDVCPNDEGMQTSTEQCTTSPEEPKEKKNGHTRGHTHGGSSGGQVLGASTECSPTLSSFLGRGYPNPPAEVMKLQTFLNEEMGTNLPITGVFGPMTEAAVHAFQQKYWEEVLMPWFEFPELNIHDADDSTGIVYKTTKWKINNLSCAGSEALPTLP